MNRVLDPVNNPHTGLLFSITTGGKRIDLFATHRHCMNVVATTDTKRLLEHSEIDQTLCLPDFETGTNFEVTLSRLSRNEAIGMCKTFAAALASQVPPSTSPLSPRQFHIFAVVFLFTFVDDDFMMFAVKLSLHPELLAHL